VPRAVLMIDASPAGGEAGLALLSVANRPVILRVLDSFAQIGIRELVVAVEPSLAPRVRDLLESGRAWPFALSYQHRSAGEALLEALSVAGRMEPDGPLLLHWACGLFKAPLASLLRGTSLGPLDAVLLVDPATRSVGRRRACGLPGAARGARAARGPRS
jgi:dTDP-glucose pyrophosphorylase